MNLRTISNILLDNWSNIRFDEDCTSDKLTLKAKIFHPNYEGCNLELEVIVFSNGARHVTLDVGEISGRYIDRALENVSTFNFNNAWMRTYIDFKKNNSLNVYYSAVGYSSLPEEEVAQAILLATNLILGEKVAEQAMKIYNGEYL